MTKASKIHHEGPGLKVLNTETWYGPGYCGICGHTGEALVARSVRYWDCDDGWRNGVLCLHCGEDCAERGPNPDDYAMQTQEDPSWRGVVIDTNADLGDLDATYSESEQ